MTGAGPDLHPPSATASHTVVRRARQAAGEEQGGSGNGVRSRVLIGRETGSTHLQLQVSELDAGAEIAPHVHAHEESVYILDGEVDLWLGDSWHALGVDCFATVPLGSLHAWRNRSGRTARWFTVRAPLPPLPDEPGMVQIDVLDASLGELVRTPGPVLPWRPAVGRLTAEDLPPYGPLSINGLGHYGTHVRRISVAMAVDRYRGAVHHTMFVVEAPPRTGGPAAGSLAHAHPFEEAFFILEGETDWQLGGERVHAEAGDLVWAGVGASHGVMSATAQPARWIEVQAPAPPAQHGFVFPHEWRELADSPGHERHAGPPL
jgi:quercetin dioxygenase-like cupin family protein